MRQVLPEEVKAAALKANLTWVPHHACSVCLRAVGYIIGKDGDLWFESGCDCSDGSGSQPRLWDSVSDWINMQESDTVKLQLMKRFGMTGE